MLKQYYDDHHLDEYFSSDMSPYLEIIHFKAGESICREEDEADFFMFFVKGRAKVYSTLSNGKSLLLRFYDGFEVIGDLELFYSDTIQTNVEALENCICLKLPLFNTRELLESDVKFVKKIASGLSRKLNRISKNASINILYPLENRLSSYILATSENGIFKENLTQTAELLGTSYRHLLRTIKDLTEQQIIQKTGHTYEILNVSMLKQLASDLYY